MGVLILGVLILLLKVVVILASLLWGRLLFHGPSKYPVVEGLLSGADGRYLQDGDVSTAGA